MRFGPQAKASSHFGTQAIHGVVVKCVGPWERGSRDCSVEKSKRNFTIICGAAKVPRLGCVHPLERRRDRATSRSEACSQMITPIDGVF